MNIFSAPTPPRDFFRSAPNESDLREFLDFEMKAGGALSLSEMAIRYPETKNRLVEVCLQRKRPDLASDILRKVYRELFAGPLAGNFGRRLQKLHSGVELLFTELTEKQLHLSKASTFSLLYQTHYDLPQVKIKEQDDVNFVYLCDIFCAEKPFDPQMMVNVVATLLVLEGNRFLSQALKVTPPDILTSLKRKLGPEMCCDYAEEIVLLEEMYQRLQLMKTMAPTLDTKPFTKRLYEKFFPSPSPILKEPDGTKKNN